MTDVQLLQQIDSGGFFSGDTLYYTEVSGISGGVAGDPVPYTVHGDSFMITLLLACFLMAVYAIANARSFIIRQLRTFFYVHSEGTTEITETAVELRFQMFLVLLTCMVLSLLAYFYTIHYIGDTFSLHSDYQLIAIYFAFFVVYYLLKALLSAKAAGNTAGYGNFTMSFSSAFINAYRKALNAYAAWACTGTETSGVKDADSCIAYMQELFDEEIAQAGL